MNGEAIKSETKAFIHNATIFLCIVLAAIALIYVAIYFATNWKPIATWGMFAADSVWSFLKSIPAWLWIVLAILKVGWMITAALADIAARLPAPPEDDDDLIVP